MKYCPKCGTKLEESMKFCPECGQRVTDSSLEEKKPYWDYLMEESRMPWEKDKGHSLMPSNLLPKLVKTVPMVCRDRMDEVHTALVEYYKDSITGEVTRKVKCRGDCSDCPYRDVE